LKLLTVLYFSYYRYYSYGLKIAGISSRKLPDAAEGHVKNEYQYQGDYNDFDEDLGWNDFQLRNYDPQIGRWIQQDPYDEFPSPYTGIGNDPINNVDPTGGFLGLSPLASIGVKTLGGAIIGMGVDAFTGGDGRGALIGAGAGLLSGVVGSFGFKAVRSGVVLGVGMAVRQNPYASFASNQTGGKIIITPAAAAQPNIAQAIEYITQSGALSDIFKQITSGSLGNTDFVFDIARGGPNEAGHSGIYGYSDDMEEFSKPLSEWAQAGYLEEKDFSTNMPLQLKVQIGKGNSVGYNTETIAHEIVLHITSWIVLVKYLRSGATPSSVVKVWYEKTQKGAFANDSKQHSDFANPKSKLRKAFNSVIDKVSKFIKNVTHRKELKDEAVKDPKKY
jgi:RHS repeat-associated protein